MKAPSIIFFILIFTPHCFGATPSVMDKRLKTYRKYLRAGKIDYPVHSARPKTPARPIKASENDFRTALKKEYSNNQAEIEVSGLLNLQREYFQNLYSIYQKTGKTFRDFVAFLKGSKDLRLKEFKIRSQQLKLILQKNVESLVFSQSRLEELLKFSKTLEREMQSNSIEFMNTVYFQKFVEAQSRLTFQKETFHFILDKVASLEIFHLKEFIKRSETWIDKVETINSKNWDRSYKSLAFRESNTLVHEVGTDLDSNLKDLKTIKKHFVFAESQLLATRDRLGKVSMPGSTKDSNLLYHRFEKISDSMRTKIQNYLEQEKIQISILKGLGATTIRAANPVLKLPPLSKHLFFHKGTTPSALPQDERLPGSNFKKESKDFSGDKENVQLPDWI